MKKIYLFLSIFALLVSGCDVSVSVVSPTSPAPLPTDIVVQASVTPIVPTLAPTQIPASPTAVPATIAPSATPTVQQPPANGVEVSYGSVNLVLPTGMASGISGSQFSRSEGPDVPQWGRTPGHTQVKLEGYVLQGKSREPQIYVYPGVEYATQNPTAFESLHRLDNILAGSPVASEGLPPIPFFNEQQVFASNVQVISFQNGRGMRFLTEYAQSAVSANNQDLFYEFQGITNDGVYYIVAILPITAQVLTATGEGGAVAYPDINDPNADWPRYYQSVTEVLNVTPSESFAPSLSQLDALIQSMRVTP